MTTNRRARLSVGAVSPEHYSYGVRMRRVWVVGNSGSGKSTLAAALAARLGVRYVEIDAVRHQANWVELESTELRRRLLVAIESDGWVVDGNYSGVADKVADAADTVVWLDLPRRTVMRQIVLRTLQRIVRREELWNGNRERWRNFFSLDPEVSVIMWAWTSHARYAARYAELHATAEASPGGQQVVRLRSRADADRFLRSV